MAQAQAQVDRDDTYRMCSAFAVRGCQGYIQRSNYRTSRHEFLTAAFLCFFKNSRRVMKDSTTTPHQAIAAGASAAAAAASLNFTAAQQATAAAQAAVTSGQGVLSQDPRLNLDP